jgi:hypothetical protein
LSERADQFLDEGDMAGAETWHRILNAIGDSYAGFVGVLLRLRMYGVRDGSSDAATMGGGSGRISLSGAPVSC